MNGHRVSVSERHVPFLFLTTVVCACDLMSISTNSSRFNVLCTVSLRCFVGFFFLFCHLKDPEDLRSKHPYTY